MTKKTAVVSGLVVAVLVGFLVFRPDKLFVDDPVDESLGDAFAAQAAPNSTTDSITTETTTAPTTVPPTTTSPTTVPPTSTTAPATTTTTTAPAPAEFSTGAFFGIDHRASGTAAIYTQEGRYVLRFEDDTDIQNGPDLYVWVTEGTDWDDPGVYLDLGKLKGNVGGQNYELPPEFDPEVHRNVLIWCLRFDVPFAAAELQGS